MPPSRNKGSQAARELMIRVARMGWQRGYLAATDGNLTCRLGDDRLLVTPSGRSKAFITEDDLIEVDLDGKVLAGEGKPSSELKVHLAAYAARPDTRAVSHTHPPHIAALTASGLDLGLEFLPEGLISLGRVPTVAYCTPGTQELADAVGAELAGHPAVIMGHHGAVACGGNLEQAWALTEKLEHAAQVMIAAKSLGGPQPLPQAECARLLAMGGRESGPLPPLAERVQVVTLPVTTEFLREKRTSDDRGSAHFISDGRPWLKATVLTIRPGTGPRGNHLHMRKTECFYILSGRGRMQAACPATGQRMELELKPGVRVIMPPGVAHRLEVTGKKSLTFVELCDRSYDQSEDRLFDFG